MFEDVGYIGFIILRIKLYRANRLHMLVVALCKRGRNDYTRLKR